MTIKQLILIAIQHNDQNHLKFSSYFLLIFSSNRLFIQKIETQRVQTSVNQAMNSEIAQNAKEMGYEERTIRQDLKRFVCEWGEKN